MPRQRRRIFKTLLWVVGSGVALCLVALLIYFPGKQFLLAFTLGTGIGVTRLQTQIDQLEEKAINGQPLSLLERRFLFDLYSCFAKGGVVVAPQSSKMMHRYLSGTGEPLAVAPCLFNRSGPVRDAMNNLTKQVIAEIKLGRGMGETYSSDTFYMGDPSYFDALVGLYYGRIQVRPRKIDGNVLVLAWRAEVPWTWPTYQELFDKYGDYHAQCFPLPNATALILGPKYCLRIDDGLGGHLSAIGIAKPFLVHSDWEERLALGSHSQ